MNRQRACFLEERAFIEDGTQAVDVGEMLIRSASSQVNLSAHSGSMNKTIRQVTRDAGADSRAQSPGRINKAIPQLHLAGSCVRLCQCLCSALRKIREGSGDNTSLWHRQRMHLRKDLPSLFKAIGLQLAQMLPWGKCLAFSGDLMR